METKYFDADELEEARYLLWDHNDMYKDFEYFKETKDTMKQIIENCNNDYLRFYKDDMLDQFTSKKDLIKSVKEDIFNQEEEMDKWEDKLEKMIEEGYQLKEEDKEEFETLFDQYQLELNKEEVVDTITMEVDGNTMDFERIKRLMNGMKGTSA